MAGQVWQGRDTVATVTRGRFPHFASVEIGMLAPRASRQVGEMPGGSDPVSEPQGPMENRELAGWRESALRALRARVIVQGASGYRWGFRRR